MIEGLAPLAEAMGPLAVVVVTFILVSPALMMQARKNRAQELQAVVALNQRLTAELAAAEAVIRKQQQLIDLYESFFLYAEIMLRRAEEEDHPSAGTLALMETCDRLQAEIDRRVMGFTPLAA